MIYTIKNLYKKIRVVKDRARIKAKKYLREKVYKSLPEYLREYIEYRYFKNKVKDGVKLINEEEVKSQFKKAIKLLKKEESVDKIGDYLEFGVFYGSSIVCMREVMDNEGIKNSKIIGFDSFEGLPSEEYIEEEEPWEEGDFKSNYRFAKEYIKNNANSENIFLVKGWFRDTLKEDTIEKYSIEKASIIMVDCDIYESAKEALEFSVPLIKDRSIVIFDDWGTDNLDKKGAGEKKAFEETIGSDEELTAEEIGRYAYDGRAKGRVFKVSRS